jgi:hypothetical protein
LSAAYAVSDFFHHQLLQVAMGLVTAKATRIVWPPSRWQTLEPTDTNDRIIKDRFELNEEKQLSDAVDDLISNSYDRIVIDNMSGK